MNSFGQSGSPSKPTFIGNQSAEAHRHRADGRHHRWGRWIIFVLTVWICATTSTNAQTCSSGGCSDASCGCCDCNGNCLIDSSGGCCGVTPVIIDISGKGFSLTSADAGVDFDFFGTGHKIRISWTAQGAANAWLVLDRNRNGLIDDGTEMFGNITPQPKTPNPNGFLALAVFDLPENGGNGDGVIDAKDSIYSSLRLWIDKNHNGISEPDELYTLPQMEIESIDLHYKISERVDQFGNRFRYKSTVVEGPRSLERTVYDVFLVIGQPRKSL